MLHIVEGMDEAEAEDALTKITGDEDVDEEEFRRANVLVEDHIVPRMEIAPILVRNVRLQGQITTQQPRLPICWVAIHMGVTG